MPDIPRDIQKRMQERYPMLEIRWSRDCDCFEIWERHGNAAVCDGWRRLWQYENPDGSLFPMHFDVLMGWLQRADTRNHYWQNHDLFQEIMATRKAKSEEKRKRLTDNIGAVITDDYKYFAGIKTFFMDPHSMPVHASTARPSQAAEAARLGISL